MAEQHVHEAEGEPPDTGSALALVAGVPPGGRHPLSRAPGRAARYRRRHHPGVTAREWDDWRWQLAHRLRSRADLEPVLRLSPGERKALGGEGGDALPVAFTPYYASLLDPDDPGQPLRRTVVPTAAEQLTSRGEEADPLAEEDDSPVPGLVHRYPDRVLFLVTGTCSAYCRYCTRSRMVGQGAWELGRRSRWEAALGYIRAHREVRDVLLSGGDPLTQGDDALDWILGELRRIPHLEIVRIGTKVPAVLPQRVTPALVRLLRRHHPLWMSLHFTHPDELTAEVERATGRLADAGIPLGSQTVLLAGINDRVETLRTLVHGLLRLRVRPYYLYQCDPVPGSAHFRTPVSRGIEVIEGLRGHTSGYAVPSLVIDAPGGGGKIPLLPRYLVGRDGDDLLLRSHTGRVHRYPDPELGSGRGLPC